MKKYIGTKTIMAMPMAKSEAEKVLNRSLADAKGGEDGYLVEYPDGYKSWSPKETFEEAYKVADTYLDRMRIEYDELKNRYLRLVDFGLSEKFRTIHPEQRKRMERQSRTMLDYLHVLAERIDDAKKQQLAHTQEAAAAHKKRESLVGKIVICTGFECATCKFDELDEDCLKLDVPGIGTLCLGDNPMQWRDIKDTKLETRAYFVHQYWPNNKRFVFVAEYNAEKDEWRPWSDIEVAGMPLDNFQREQITHVMPVFYPVLLVPQNKMDPINFTDDE